MFKKFYISFIIFLSILCVFFSSNINKGSKIQYDNTLLHFPIENRYYSSYYGYRDFNGVLIYAASNGVIINSSFIRGYGNCIMILHDDGKKTLYGHLSENFIVYNGKYVKKGQNIGYVGPKYLSDGRLNGYTTGCHLHFTIFLQDGKTIDPLSFTYENK